MSKMEADFDFNFDFSDHPEVTSSFPSFNQVTGAPWEPPFVLDDLFTSNFSSTANLGDYLLDRTASSFSPDQFKFPSYSSYMDACKSNQIIDELIQQKKLLKKEIMDLHRQNYVLESEKEKLIMELISTGISNSNSNHDDADADADEVEEDEDEIDEPQSVESPEDDVSKALIQELEYKLAEAQERCAKLEEENCEYSDKVFDLKMDKQRLNVKLQHFTELNKILEENNDELQKEVATLQEKTEKLNANLEKLEQKIERIEEGDFEHVSADAEGNLPSSRAV